MHCNGEMMKIVLYRDGSASSEEAALFLYELGVQFEEVDIRTNMNRARLLKRTQQSSVPAFELKRNRSIGIIVGLDRELLKMELGMVK